MASSEHSPRVALLCTDALMRSALGRLLRELGSYAVVAVVEDAAAFKRAFALGPAPHVVVLSLENAMADGCAMLNWLHKHMPDACSILVGPEPVVPALVQAFRSGAHGSCCTKRELERFPDVLAHVSAGALSFPGEVLQYLREHVHEPHDMPTRAPTARECQVLSLLGRADAPTLLAIATELGVHESRVKAICRKLRKVYGVSGKPGLVKLGIRLGLIAT